MVFRRSPTYQIFTGPTLYGGPTPDGKGALINFCVDHHAFPSYVEHPVRPDGTVALNEVTNIAQVGNVEREVQAGLYLSTDEIERTVIWLTDILNKLKGGRQ